MKKLLLSSTYALGTVFITSFISNYIFYLNTSNVFGVHMAANVSFITTLVAGITLIIVGYPIHYYFQNIILNHMVIICYQAQYLVQPLYLY